MKLSYIFAAILLLTCAGLIIKETNNYFKLEQQPSTIVVQDTTKLDLKKPDLSIRKVIPKKKALGFIQDSISVSPKLSWETEYMSWTYENNTYVGITKTEIINKDPYLMAKKLSDFEVSVDVQGRNFYEGSWSFNKILIHGKMSEGFRAAKLFDELFYEE